MDYAKARQARVSKYERLSMLGARFKGVSFADFQQGPHNEAAAKVANDWVANIDDGDSSAGNLFVHGPIGSGKTFLAACLFRMLQESMVPALWLSVPHLLADVKAGFKDDDARERTARLYEAAASADVLFLDDLGKTHPGGQASWVEEQLYLFVDKRYVDMLPTVVTTEWSSKVLSERVGESVVTRLETDAMVAGIFRPAVPYRRRVT
jgi:DNA replication protein DnaC